MTDDTSRMLIVTSSGRYVTEADVGPDDVLRPAEGMRAVAYSEATAGQQQAADAAVAAATA